MRTPPSTRAVTVGIAMRSSRRDRTRQFFRLVRPAPPRCPPGPPGAPGLPGTRGLPRTPGACAAAPGAPAPLAPFHPASAWLPLDCGPVADPALGAAGCPSGGVSCSPAGATDTSGTGARLLGTPLPRVRDPRLVLIRDLPGLEPPTSPRTRA